MNALLNGLTTGTRLNFHYRDYLILCTTNRERLVAFSIRTFNPIL
jgi:hypothetical protein